MVYLTLGSNIEPERNLRAAVRELDAVLGVEAVSRAYEAAPVGAPGSPRFLNAAVAVRTPLDPGDLKFRILRPIEARLGRVRTSDPNAPRTIDLDIALVDGARFVDEELELHVPDPELGGSAHLALPLRDLAPDLVPPGHRATLADLAARLEPGADIRVREDIDLRERPA